MTGRYQGRHGTPVAVYCSMATSLVVVELLGSMYEQPNII